MTVSAASWGPAGLASAKTGHDDQESTLARRARWRGNPFHTFSGDGTMSNLSPPSVNRKAPRKRVAEQLDRLDTIIDVLADGLNETVADVVKQAVAASLQTLLSNPALLCNLAAKVTPPLPEPLDVPEQKPGHAARLTDRL